MLTDRSTKTFWAVATLVAAILLAIRAVVVEAALKDWWPIIVLLLISMAFWVWLWQQKSATEAEEKQAPPGKVATTVDQAKKAVAKAEAAVTTVKDTAAPTPKAPPAPVAKTPPVAKAEVAVPTVKETAAPTPKAPPAPVAKTPPVAKAPAPVEEKAADDFTRIEGVGPKFRDVLIAAGIKTYAQLAKTDEASLTVAIKAAGMRRPASVVTWAEQAGYAARGDWEGLAKLQSELSGGRR